MKRSQRFELYIHESFPNLTWYEKACSKLYMYLVNSY